MEMGLRSRAVLSGAVALALVVGVVVAGCGSSTDAATGGTVAGKSTIDCGENTGKPASGTPIKVGAIVGKTGPADFSSAAQAAQAYFDCVNANGGIHGQPIEYLVEDDHWEPAIASSDARKLVQEDGVVAMVGNTSFVECGINAKYYEEQDVAVIAGVGVPRECFHSKNIAPVNEGPRLSGIAAAQLAAENGAKKIACVSNKIPNFGGWACQGMQEWGEAEGVEVETFLGEPDASDAESTVLKALQWGPEAVVPVDAAPQTTAYLKVGQQQGSGGPDQPWFLPTAAYNIEIPKAIGTYWNEKLKLEIELAPLDSQGADAELWRGVMNKYGKDAPRDTFSQAGFLAAKIFAATLIEGNGPYTRSSVTEALKAIKGYESDLLCGPWYFGDASEHNANHEGAIMELTGSGPTGFKELQKCAPINDPQLAPILKAEEEGKD